MKNLNQIIKHTIKKIIKEQDELYVDQPQVKIKGKSGEYETNFETFTAPNGRSILVPEDLKPVVKLYDKQLWLNYVTSTSSLRNHYNKYISANEDIYAKACNDEYLKNLIFEFDKVSKNYIQILDLKGPKYWPSDLNNEEGLQYYYILSKLKYNPNYTIKPSDFKGFDYYFKKMSEWLSQSNYKDVIKLEKGGSKSKHNFDIATYNGADQKISDYYVPKDDVTIYNGTTVPKENLMLDWWDWSLTTNKYCDTEGSWTNYYNSQVSFVTSLIQNSAYSISVLKQNLFKYYKSDTSFDINKFKTDPNDELKVIFSACYKTTYNTEGIMTHQFADYYSYSNDWNEENIKKKIAGDCSGIKFPTMADILDANDVAVKDESGKLMTYAKNSVVSIPLVDINVGYVGKVFKGQTKRIERKEKGRDWFWLGEDGGVGFGEDLGSFVTYVWDDVASKVTFWDPSDDFDKYKGASGVDPNLFQTKESFTMKTPLNAITKGIFKDTDYIDTTKINEDTEVWKIPKEGLSPYIPGAIKPKRYGSPGWDFYYLKYNKGSNDIQARLPLPPASFWDEFKDYYYKIKNVVSDNWLNKTYPEFGLVLTIVGAENFRLVQETNGRAGWTLKIDNNSGSMYFTKDPDVDPGFKVDEKTGENKMYFNGFDYDNKTWGSPEKLNSYNFYNKEYFDDRSKFDAFWDSHWGTITQVVVGIAISVVASPLAFGIAEGLGWGAMEAGSFVLAQNAPSIASTLLATGTFNVTRLAVLVEVVTDVGILGLPGAISYWHRGETVAGTFSLLCSLIPVVTSKTSFQKWSRKIWPPSVGRSLSEEIIKMGPNYFGPNFNIYRLFAFLGNLNRQQAAAFGDLMQKLSSKEAPKLIEETFKYSGEYIALAIKESPEIAKKVGLKIEHKSLIFAKPFVAVGGTILVTQTTIKTLVDYYSQKGVELTQKQKDNLSNGFNKLYEKINSDSEIALLNSIQQKIKEYDNTFTTTPTEEWIQKQMKENQDLFDKMLVNNGWESVSDLMKKDYYNKKKEEIKEKEKLFIFMMINDSVFVMRMSSNFVIEDIKGDITNKETVQDKIKLITNQYPCIDDVNFTFDSAQKTPNSNYWWVSFVINTTESKGTKIYFAGNNNGLLSDGIIVSYNNGTYDENYNDEFNKLFPDCVSYILKTPLDKKYKYKKEVKTGKYYKTLKIKDSWSEITNQTEIQDVSKNIFGE
jgi:hypothetical protein